MRMRRIIEDISFGRFIRELVDEVKKHPDCVIEGTPDCHDEERADNAFMFYAVITYEGGK